MLTQFLLAKCIDNPIFITGGGRSGTTVLGRALGAEPSILLGADESPLINRVANLANEFEHGEKADYFQRNQTTTTPYLLRSLRTLIFESAMGPRMGRKKIIAKFVRNKCRTRLTHWVAKIGADEPTYNGLALLYPQAKHLYMVRNGLNFVYSRTKYKGFDERPFTEHCELWVKYATVFKYLLGKDNALPLRHEDLLADPDTFFQKIADFLNIPHLKAATYYSKTTIVHPLDQNDQQTQSAQQTLTSRPPAHTHFTEDQKQTFKSICAQAMQDHGYDIPF